MASKKQWDTWAQKNNGRYIALTNRDNWTEEEFNKQGEKHIAQYVVPFLQEKGIDPKNLFALDIGCGPGRLTRALSTIFGRVVGVDISKEMIRQARISNRSLDFIEAEANALPFLGTYFHFVFSFITFQHFQSKTYSIEAFKEVYRVLKPGGYALIQVRAVPGRRRLPFVWIHFNRLWFGLARTKGMPLPAIGYAGAFNSHYGPTFKPAELTQKLQDIGFRGVEVTLQQDNKRLLWASMRK